MTSKFELSISTGYVPDWGIVEAFRELFQNALDNEAINPDNKMSWEYKDNEVIITNKTSKLPVESLLLGTTTKADDTDTIGKHGEGYKIAFMVLLRNNKKIKVFNYGAREVWDVRLVKSRKYNGQLVPTVFIEKNYVWNKVPNNDLTISVSGITQDEYNLIVEKNLHLRYKSIEKYTVSDRGSIIFDENEKGNIYVKGLFVTHMNNLQYGYDFEPRVLGLDRDRKLVDSFNVSWEASVLWIDAVKNKPEYEDKAVELVNTEALDVRYVGKMSYGNSINNAVAKDFFNTHGNDAVPVTSNEEYRMVESYSSGYPVIVSEDKAKIIRDSELMSEQVVIKIKTVKERLHEFVAKIEHKLTDEELDELTNLINELND